MPLFLTTESKETIYIDFGCPVLISGKSAILSIAPLDIVLNDMLIDVAS